MFNATSALCGISSNSYHTTLARPIVVYMPISKLAVYVSQQPWGAVPRWDAVWEALCLRHAAPASGHLACWPPAASTPRLSATAGSTSYALARRRTGTPSERRSASEMSRRRLVVQRTRPPAASTPRSVATAGSNSSASARRSTGGELDIVGELHVSPTVVGGEGCRKGEILHGLGDGGGE
jgi:hypothetical protein